MIKNAIPYKVAMKAALTQADIEQHLAAAQFISCGPTQQKSSGFVPPREENGALAELIDGQIIVKLMSEQRVVPGDVLKRRTNEIAEQIEQSTGRKPGKKQTKELKEQALLELLPLAFTKRKTTLVWIDQAAGMVVVDSTSQGQSEDVITLLIKCVDGLSMSLVNTETSPAVAMAHWLGTGEAPHQFSVDRECELKSCDEMKSVVKYGRHPLDTEEVRQHILAGKVPTKLALTWRDRVSFVLTDSLQIKKLEFLDVVFEGTKENQADAFDADVAIMTGELRQLLPDLIDALGGELVMDAGTASEPANKSATDAGSSESPWDGEA